MQIFLNLQKMTAVTRVRGVSQNNWTPPPPPPSLRRFRCMLFLLLRTVRRHGSTRVPGHSFLAWRSLWWMDLLYDSSWKFHPFTAVGSSCQSNRYGIEKAGGTTRPSRTKSHIPGHSLPAVLGQHSSLRPHWFKNACFYAPQLNLCKPVQKLVCILHAAPICKFPHIPAQVSDHGFQNSSCIAGRY